MAAASQGSVEARGRGRRPVRPRRCAGGPSPHGPAATVGRGPGVRRAQIKRPRRGGGLGDAPRAARRPRGRDRIGGQPRRGQDTASNARAGADQRRCAAAPQFGQPRGGVFDQQVVRRHRRAAVTEHLQPDPVAPRIDGGGDEGFRRARGQGLQRPDPDGTGRPGPATRPFAKARPTRRPVKEPGPTVTAMRPRSAGRAPASCRHSATIGASRSWWPRLIGSERAPSTRGPSITAAEQASRQVSIPRIFTNPWPWAAGAGSRPWPSDSRRGRADPAVAARWSPSRAWRSRR